MKLLKFLFKLLIVIVFIALVIQFILSLNSKPYLVSKPHILVLELKGVIIDSKSLIKKLSKAEKNEMVKGVILKIDSPGGAVAPSQEIYRFIRKMKKPVYAAIQTLGASGGYYVASACDKIYALGGSITGSIGVIMKFSNLKKLYDKIGIKMITIKSGKFKDIGSSSRDMTDEEKKLLEEAIKDVYYQFVNDIIKARNIKKNVLLKYADGRILTGHQAKNIGLVDKIGTYRDAFEDMKKEFHFDKEVILFEEKKEKSFIKELLDTISDIKLKINESGIFYYLYTN